jgi:alcohol dehydrogenase class IV
MKNFTLLLPTVVHFGEGAVSALETARIPGKTGVIITGGKSSRKNGYIDMAGSCLEKAGKKIFVFENVEPEVSVETVDRAAAFCRQSGAEFIVGLGGGSALDCAKAAAACAAENISVKSYLDGTEKIIKDPFFLVAIPTTAGTGSEVTKNAVLTYTKKKIKISLRDDRLVPGVVIADPELTYSMTKEITANSGMDALTHAVESYFSSGANGLTKALSLSSAKMIFGNIEEAYENGSKVSRHNMLLGSMEAGLAFSNAGLGAAHGLGHPIGAVCHLPHGLVNAIILPYVLEYNMDECAAEMKELESLLGIKIIQELKRLKSIFSIPDKISGVCAKAVEKADEILATTAYSGSMQYNPVKMNPERAKELLMRVL